MKQGNHLTRKALSQDNARRNRKPPVGRTALPKPAGLPPAVTWIAWIFIAGWTLIIIGAVKLIGVFL